MRFRWVVRVAPIRRYAGDFKLTMLRLTAWDFAAERIATPCARCKPDEFAQRVREVGGFSLDNVPRAGILAPPDLPPVVPVLFHGDKRRGRFLASSAACLPLYQVVSRQDGLARYENAKTLAEGFGIAQDVKVVLTGTAVDPPLERWWSLGPARRDAIRGLADLKVAMVTIPNFSLFTDQPRWDDMHKHEKDRDCASGVSK